MIAEFGTAVVSRPSCCSIKSERVPIHVSHDPSSNVTLAVAASAEFTAS